LKIPIIYFSSSGNTKYICEIISCGINSLGIKTELIPLKNLKKYPHIIQESKIFGIGSPIYGLNFSPNILNFVRKIPKTNKKKQFFLVYTFAGINGGALSTVKAILVEKRYQFIGGLEIIVPTRDSVVWLDSFNRIKWNERDIKKSYYFGRSIVRFLQKDGKPIKCFKEMPFGKIASKLFQYIERPGYKLLTKLMARNPYKCTKCGACELKCPAGAIDVKNEIWFDPKKCFSCFLCMRTCPRHALYFKLFPKNDFFKGPFQIKGYIPPKDIKFH